MTAEGLRWNEAVVEAMLRGDDVRWVDMGGRGSALIADQLRPNVGELFGECMTRGDEEPHTLGRSWPYRLTPAGYIRALFDCVYFAWIELKIERDGVSRYGRYWSGRIYLSGGVFSSSQAAEAREAVVAAWKAGRLKLVQDGDVLTFMPR